MEAGVHDDDLELLIFTSSQMTQRHTDSPEQRLWRAVLEQTRDDIVAPGIWRPDPGEDPAIWIGTHDHRTLGFDWLCDLVGLDASRARTAMLAPEYRAHRRYTRRLAA